MFRSDFVCECEDSPQTVLCVLPWLVGRLLQVRVLCGVLKLPAQGVKRTVAQPDAVQLLLMHPEGVKKGFVAAAKAAGGEASVRALLRQQPAALLPGRQGRLRKSVRTQP